MGLASPLPKAAPVPVPSCRFELQALAIHPDVTTRMSNPNRKFSVWGMFLSPVSITVGLARRETNGG
jgi:hypothetical protein